ncbi:MAG TPA: hypothetical protein VFK69_08230 [Candidatus Eisenbacteria bacterium]|nr:hypothetical protein [Candidatus Eisenbacteria bacterium]
MLHLSRPAHVPAHRLYVRGGYRPHRLHDRRFLAHAIRSAPVSDGLGRLLLWLALLASLAPAVARSQSLRPWTPSGADSLLVWAADAEAKFRAAQGDSVVGDNYAAYDIVGRAGRRLLGSLGRANVRQAALVESALDSLGLETHIALDASQPDFVLLMVRNPYRPTAHAVGYLYWYRNNDLRMQGVEFPGGLRPQSRVWWTGDRSAPYEWGVIQYAGDPQVPRLSLFHLDPSGAEWLLQQDDAEGTLLGGPGQATFADLNNDGRPEVVAWLRAPTDSLFRECPDCPHLTIERTLVERREGFQYFDQRLVPSPYATFVAFVRLLHDHNLAAARRLLETPAHAERALALGFGEQRGKGTWSIEYGEPGEPWPRWLEMRFDGPHGVRRYVVHFAMHDGHWLIHDWIEPHVVATGGVRVDPSQQDTAAPARPSATRASTARRPARGPRH